MPTKKKNKYRKFSLLIDFEMLSLIIRRSRSRFINGIKITSILSSSNSLTDPDSLLVSRRSFNSTTPTSSSFGFEFGKISNLNQKFGKFDYSGSNFFSTTRSLSSEAVAVAATCDGLTVERIIANQWSILDESESDWKSHAAAIAQSIQVIKRRLQVIIFTSFPLSLLWYCHCVNTQIFLRIHIQNCVYVCMCVCVTRIRICHCTLATYTQWIVLKFT